MSEQLINPDPSAPPQIGSRLTAARAAKALTVDQVARKLLVSASQIQAIEAGRMPSSYSALYYEQIVRKYSDFLEVEIDPTVLPSAAASVDQVHAASQQASPAGRLAGFTPQRVGIAGRVDMPTLGGDSGAKKWAIAVVIALFILGGFLLKDRLLDPSPETAAEAEGGQGATPTSTAGAAPAPASPGATGSTPMPPAAPVSSATPSARPAEGAAAAPTATTASAAPTATAANSGDRDKVAQAAATGPGTSQPAATPAKSDSKGGGAAARSGRLVLTFMAPCWVQSIASDGTKSEKIYQPDQELVLQGDSLAALTIGNARSARMTIDGTEVSLTQFMKGSSDVARMSDAGLQALLR